MSRWTQLERVGTALYCFSPSGPHEIELFPGDAVKVCCCTDVNSPIHFCSQILSFLFLFFFFFLFFFQKGV